MRALVINASLRLIMKKRSGFVSEIRRADFALARNKINRCDFAVYFDCITFFFHPCVGESIKQGKHWTDPQNTWNGPEYFSVVQISMIQINSITQIPFRNQGINTFLLKVLEFILIQNIKVSKLYEFPSCVRFVRKLRRFWKSHSSDTFVCRGNEAYVTVVKLEWSYWSYMRNTLTYKRGAYLYNMRYTYLCRVFSGSKYTCTAFVHVCLCVPSYFENGPGSLVRKRSNLAPIAYLIEWGVGVVNIRPSSRGDLVLIWMGVFEG